MKVISVILLTLLIIAMSLGVTELVVWGICACFGWAFNFWIGVGIWLIMALARSVFRGNGSK